MREKESRNRLAATALSLFLLAGSLLGAQALTNGTFQTNLNGWTNYGPTNNTRVWDAAGQANGGALRIEALGRKTGGDNGVQQTVNVTAGATVTLSFYWKKDWAVAAPNPHTLYVDILKPNALTVRLWEDTNVIQGGAWTFVTLDVTASFDLTGAYDLMLGADYKNGNDNAAATYGWFDEVILDVVAGNAAPTATVTNPANGSNIGGPGPYSVTGTASDSDGTVTAVDVEIQRQDTSQYWNGTGWQAGAVWLAATGTTSWSYSWAWTTDLEGTAVNVTARATDDGAATGTDTNATTVDSLAPRIATGVRFQTSPTSGDASFTLLSDWTEANPGTPTFDYNLNAAGYLGAVAGSAGNASSRTFTVALNGDDRFLAIQSEHTDSFGNGPTLSEDTTVAYVLPLTPPAPGVGGATSSSLDVTINANGAETGVGMVYAVRSDGTGEYVQADGTLGASPVWRTLAAWGTPVTVTGLTENTGYTFSVAAGNPSDATPTTPERSASAFGTGTLGTTLVANPETTAGAVTHSQAGCNVTVEAAFTGDGDNDGSTSIQAKTGTNCNGGGYLTIGCDSVTGASPRTCLHSGLTPNSDWCYLVTFTDPDGVLGTNPIRYGSINTGACGGGTTTTVGDGTNPGDATICPNDAVQVDAFTLVTNVATDTVTSVQVTLAGEADIFNRVASVEITSDDGLTVYGTVANPPANVVNVSVNIPVSTSPVQYKVRITAEDHPNLASPTHTVTATVTDVTVSGAKSVSDTTSATVTIDNAPPSDATWGTVTAGDGQVSLNWTNPGGDFAQAILVRNTSASVTFVPTDGVTYSLGQNVGGAQVVRYAGAGVSTIDSTVTNGTAYYYKIFTRDACGNYSIGVETGPHTPTAAAVNDLTAGAATGLVNGCNQVTITAPHTGDDDGDSSTAVQRGTAPGGPFGTTVCASLTGPSPRACVDSTVAASSTYYYQVTWTDPDGVNGTNPQVVGPMSTPACAAAGTTVTSNSATATTCKQITVTSIFSGDGDGDGSTLYEYFDGAWQTGCASVTGSSPRQCILPELSPSTSYDVRITFTDPDGVSGTNPETLASVTTPACGADQRPPTVVVLAPVRDATVGGVDLLKIQVYDDTGLASVQVSVDGNPYGAAATNANYACGTGCAVYEYTLDTTVLTNEGHYFTVRATDTGVPANVTLVSQPFYVYNAGAVAGGDGFLLRRTHGSQICIDCHDTPSHSSQTTSAKYGSWGVDCLTCHTPHLTENIFLIRELIRTPNSGEKAVSFIANATGTDFVRTSAPYDGVCNVCHTRTNHHRNDDSGGDHTHNTTTRCISCHGHDKGFAGSGCNGCHNAPPIAVGKHAVHDEVWDSTDGNTASSYSDTASHATATQYGFVCSKCHSGTHTNDATVNPTHDGSLANPWQVEVVFDATNPSGAYGQVYAQSTEQGPIGEYWSWSDGGCSNLYCHSNAAPLGGTNVFQSPTWDQLANLSCTGCHDTGGAATGLSAAHAKHTTGGTYNFGCVRCHSATVSNNTTIADKREHVDAQKDVVFDAAGVDNSGGSYDGGAHTCTNTYCHSDGKDLVPPYTSGPSIVWTLASNCATCHDTAGAASTNLSGAHFTHTETDGYAFGCERCHTNTVTDSSTIGTFANHVNGVQDVFFDSSAVNNSGGSYDSGTETCSNTYCHSDGSDLVAPYTSGPSINWPATRTCWTCHGTSGTGGAPSYPNGSPKANSHDKHVPAYTCNVCHNNVADATPSILDKTLHVNGAYNLQAGGGFSFTPSGSPTTCASNACHGDLTWGTTGSTCRDCHGKTGAGDQDVDDWVYGNATTAIVDMDDWSAYGHGNSSSYTESGNPGAGLDGGGANDGCLYCHDTGVGHNTATNPFRLRNVGAAVTAADKDGVCIACHGGAGVDPDGGGGLPSVDSTLDIDAYHYGADHGGSNKEGGTFCWDCHDPHGDYNYGSTQRLAYMIQEQPSQDHTGSTGWGAAPTLAPAPDFRADRDGVAAWDWADYVSNTLVGGFYRGVCQVCHTAGGAARFYQDSGYDAGHNSSSGRCTSCHDHDQPPSDAFKPAGGDCLGCHGGTVQNGRRAVQADFSKQSHHVGNGSANMGGTLLAEDCVVCHAEGQMSGGAATTNDPLHGGTGGDTRINLRNADTGAAYLYDKTAITGGSATWGTGNTSWQTQTSAQLDPFCLSCHDADGATQVTAGNVGEAGATALNPFNDAAITNEYDLMSRGRVVDIASRVVSSGSDLDAGGEPRGPDGIPDPPEGIYARHALRGQSVSVYTTQMLANAYWNQANYAWNDTSVMGCADCHTVDGANGTAGNAHGSDSEYLLKDASGGAAEGNSVGTYICIRCHDATEYAAVAHTENGNNYQDTTGNTGSGRVTGVDGGIYGIACLNCHGGIVSTSGTSEYGTIHGTSQLMPTGPLDMSGNPTGTPHEAYRFMNGHSLRFWSPSPDGWSGANVTCYTLGTGDAFGDCTQHSKGTTLTKAAGRVRPLSY